MVPGRFAGQPDVQNSVGTAWLDPATGEGCAFIARNIPLVEDTDGKLWTVVDGNVYYTDLNPR
ncbi:MAG: hypothetical protein IPM16_22815 [Chloroflexi bacterium]|nr:hypothetical protein [Chloroflexota bacterium]